MDRSFWQGRRVFLTGHTGFKGAWLSMWLHRLEAQVAGYALAPATRPSLYELASVGDLIERSTFADVRDQQALASAMGDHAPEVVFHLAAQPIVRTAYAEPLETLDVNVLGTASLLEAVRKTGSVRAVVVITSDKCYDNVEWVWGYRETDRLGGADPYSASKACAELVVDAYTRSYFPPDRYETHGVAVATARAGNVIGGGDWSRDRLVPDVLKALVRGDVPVLRNPDATRPWQHVLEPLAGYLGLAERLLREGPRASGPWNFGPDDTNIRSVRWVVERLQRHWPAQGAWGLDREDNPYEATMLKTDSSKARAYLGWRPRLDLATALAWIAAWERARHEGRPVRETTLAQIADYESRPAARDA